MAHPAQDQALWKPERALRIAGAQLPKHRQQGVADQGVDLVDHEHQRLGVRLRPPGKRLPKRIVGASAIENAWPDVSHEKVVERVPRRTSQRTEDRPHGRRHVLPCGLPDLDIDIHATELAAGVQLIPQCQDRGRLARLARRLQDKVLPLPDEQQEVVNVKPFQRRDEVVHLRADWAGGAEETRDFGHRQSRLLAAEVAGDSRFSRRHATFGRETSGTCLRSKWGARTNCDH